MLHTGAAQQCSVDSRRRGTRSSALSCSWIMYLMMVMYHPYLAPGLAEMEAAWEKEKAKESPDLNAKYSYAFVLCKSGSDRHQVMGIRLMQGKEEEHQQQQEKV